MTRLLALALLLALGACATTAPTPHDQLQRQAWAEPWSHEEGWHASKSSTCRQRAMFVLEHLGEERVRLITGCRTDVDGCELHVVPVVDLAYVIDFDRVWTLEAFWLVWKPIPMPGRFPGWIVYLEPYGSASTKLT